MIPFEFCHDLWHEKTRVPVLSCGITCVILRLAVVIQYRSVTDRQTHNDGIYCASIASRGKNGLWNLDYIHLRVLCYPKVNTLYGLFGPQNLKTNYRNSKDSNYPECKMRMNFVVEDQHSIQANNFLFTFHKSYVLFSKCSKLAVKVTSLSYHNCI